MPAKMRERPPAPEPFRTRHRIRLLRIPRHVAEGLATAARRWQQPGL